MKKENTNNKYSTEYIRKYLEGKLPEQEMQALEKAALEDPFLSDAMEGIAESLNHPVSFESGVSVLQKRLIERVRENNRKSALVLLFLNWKIAASIIFILGIAVLTLTYFIRKNSITEIAKSRPLPVTRKTDSISSPSSLPSSSNADSNETSISFLPPVINKKRLHKERLSAGESYSNSDTVAQPASAISSVAKNDAETQITMESPKKKEEIKVEGFARTEDKNLSGNYIKGVVTDVKGNPIPHADVSIKGAKKRAVTDQAGFFKLYMIDPEFATEVMISSAGYESALELLKPDSSYTNLIKLSPASTALNEVTVEGYGTQNAALVSGWDAFKNYIDSNKKILTADSVLKGDEVVSFVLNNKNELSSFKIEKSISLVHDAEIIRLIKSAPPLKLMKGKKKRFQLSISFN